MHFEAGWTIFPLFQFFVEIKAVFFFPKKMLRECNKKKEMARNVGMICSFHFELGFDEENERKASIKYNN